MVRAATAGVVLSLLVAREAAAQPVPGDGPPAQGAVQAPEAAPAPAEAPPAATTAPVAPAPAPAPTPLAVAAPAPTFPLAKRGTVLLSVDQALPLFSFGGVPATSQAQVSTAIGDSTARVLRPIVVDVLLTDRLTVGGSIFVQQTLTDSTLESHVGGGLVRVGGMFPLTSKLAVWPRLAGSYITSTQPEDFAYFQLSVDAKLVYAPRRSWAFTVGPSLDVPFDDGHYFAYAYTASDGMSVGSGSDRLVRIGVSAGITGRLGRSGGDDEEDASGAEREPTLLIGVDRVVPLFRYATSSTKTDADEQTAKNVDVATADLSAYAPQGPRLSVDYRAPCGFTIGMSGSVGWQKVSSDTRSLFPQPSGATVVSYALSPRAGYYKSLTKGIAVWPRAGVTYVNSAVERANGLDGDDDYHLGFDLDGFLVLSPTPGFGLVVGPSLEVPLKGKTEVADKRAEYGVFTLGLTGGIVVGL